MNPLLNEIFLSAAIVLSFAPWIAGAVIARRAAKRRDWPEARIAFYAFAAVPVLAVLSTVTFPLVSWIGNGTVILDWYRWINLPFGVANAVIVVVIAVSLYRIAQRGRAISGD